MPSNCNAPRLARALILAGLLGSSPLSAQAGPWVPIGSRLDGLASWLSDEGGLRALDPLTRPWRLAAVRQAAADQDSLALRPSARRVLGWLRAELERAADSSAVTAELGVAVYDNGRRDTFREGGSSSGGSSNTHCSVANGHRGWKRQPVGGFTRSGGSPSNGASWRRGPVIEGVDLRSKYA